MKKNKLVPILLIIFTNILGAGVIIPILPLYAKGQFQGSVFQITLLASVYFGAQFLAAPWLGKLSDRFGRRPLLLLSQVGTVLSFVLFIFAQQMGLLIDGMGLSLPLTGGMIMLFIARILDGITGGNITIAQAYISDISSDKKRTENLGLLQGAFGAGFVFGPAIGGILGNFSLVMPFIGATIITAGTLLLTFFILEESLPPEDRAGAVGHEQEKRSLDWSVILSSRPMLLILSIGFIASLAFSALPSTFSLFAEEVLFANTPNPERIELNIGLMLAANGLSQVVTQLFLIKPLVRRWGERRLLALGQISIAISFFGLSRSYSPQLAFLFLPIFAFGIGISQPNAQSLMTRFAGPHLRGYLLGLYQSSRSLALIIGPIAAGIIYEQSSPNAVYLVGSVVVMFAFMAAIMLRNMPIESIE